jgi:hypothetical protein
MALQSLAANGAGTDVDAATVALVAGLVVLYLLPIIIAAARNCAAVGRVARLDLHLGWTGIGWLAALVIACSSPTRVRAQ